MCLQGGLFWQHEEQQFIQPAVMVRHRAPSKKRVKKTGDRFQSQIGLVVGVSKPELSEGQQT